MVQGMVVDGDFHLIAENGADHGAGEDKLGVIQRAVIALVDADNEDHAVALRLLGKHVRNPAGDGHRVFVEPQMFRAGADGADGQSRGHALNSQPATFHPPTDSTSGS